MSHQHLHGGGVLKMGLGQDSTLWAAAAHSVESYEQLATVRFNVSLMAFVALLCQCLITALFTVAPSRSINQFVICSAGSVLMAGGATTKKLVAMAWIQAFAPTITGTWILCLASRPPACTRPPIPTKVTVPSGGEVTLLMCSITQRKYHSAINAAS